ncbi:1463_t:CDS:2 [Paraglomus brasilianum]|uniref:1463_t:CDS:1 n=1 Tax=Paraglomus brasilianum TaxID=144538 RepID=A0A9N8VNZ7_9GLOM|nr:1463_t:CDS:2 [Paraglomus brasilianum]
MDFYRNMERGDTSPPVSVHSIPGVLAMNVGNELDPLRDPQWDAESLIAGRFRAYTRSNLSAPSQEYNTDADESTHLLGKKVPSLKRMVLEWTSTSWRRAWLLNIFPVAVVIIWVSVPLPNRPPADSPEFQHESYFAYFLRQLITYFNSYGIQNPPGSSHEINFWFFLFFYFGFYNAVALLLITKIFDLYSLNWWPKQLGGVPAYTMFWLLSLAVGTAVYLFTNLAVYSLTWVLLTFFTMSMPLLVAFIVIRSQNRNRYRHSLTAAQKIFLERQLQSRIPESYFRFLWFCCVLFIAICALIAGEAYAQVFLRSLPHNGWEGLVYVYSWVATIYILDTVTDWIIENRIRSYPLSSVFKLYFFMIYFIFYRNLFARLRSVRQFAAVQLASSLWVCFFYPLCMTHIVYRTLVYFAGVTKSYEQYQKHLGRSFFIRNLAENATMLGFLCWVVILNMGPNKWVYPYFQFKDGMEYSFDLTVKASWAVWGSELASSFVTRKIFKHAFQHDVSKEAAKDFREYPTMVIAMVLVIIHVLQDMLLATLHVIFQGGHSSK